MIPHFPDFKKLELSDHREVESHTEKFPLYSDFDFSSIWSWDVKEEMALSILNDNLVVRFTDYTSGTPFLSYLGTKMVNETAAQLLNYSPENKLQLIPEASAVGLDQDVFIIEESRDHFDYICDVRQHIDYSDKKLKSHRTLLRQFTDAYPNFERVTLDLSLTEVQSNVAYIYKCWDENKGFITSSEAFAYERFMSAVNELPYTAVGIRIDGQLVAFHIASLPPGTHADALFSKANVAYRGVYAALDHVVALDLVERGYTHMNIQQDLGIESLRRAKQSLHPEYFLKKYSVEFRSKP